MNWLLPCIALGLAACTHHDDESVVEVVVRIVDPTGQPIPRADVWTLPRVAWTRRHWIPSDLRPYWGNPLELLHRLGSKRSADEQGRVRLPRDTIAAGDGGGFAGVAMLPATGDASDVWVLDDWRWTIFVRDAVGNPVAGVPVACAPDPEPTDGFEGLPLGLTDARGCLVVRAVGAVPVADYSVREVEGPDPAPTEFVWLEVDGMYLERHAHKVPYRERQSASVTLTMPRATKVELRLPPQLGSGAAAVDMRRFRKDVWDAAACWSDGGKHYGLVGHGSGNFQTAIEVAMAGSGIRAEAHVPSLPPDEVFPIQLALDENDIVVRAKLRDSANRVVRSAWIHVLPASDALRTWFAATDGDGVICLVLRTEKVAVDAGHGEDRQHELLVDAAPDPGWLGAGAKLHLSGLVRGAHIDAGVITLSRRQ